jgi:hypothetical protein
MTLLEKFLYTAAAQRLELAGVQIPRCHHLRLCQPNLIHGCCWMITRAA